MKRTFLRMCGVLALVWGGPPTLSAQAPPEPPADNSEEPGDSEGDVQRNQMRRYRQEMRYLQELRREVVKELKLNDEQLAAITELFKEHTRFVEEYARQPADEEQADKQREEMNELRRQLREAREAQDMETVRKLHEKMRESRAADPLHKATEEFHQSIENELNDEQKEQFQAIVQRLYNSPSRALDNTVGIRQIRRAMASLTLTTEQRDAVRQAFRDIIKSVGESGDDPEAVKKIEEQLKADIMKVLDEEQKEAFLANLERLEKEPEVWRGRTPGPERRRPQPGNVDDQPSEPDEPADEGSPEDESPEDEGDEDSSD